VEDYFEAISSDPDVQKITNKILENLRKVLDTIKFD
jgi:hypothetical protein